MTEPDPERVAAFIDQLARPVCDALVLLSDDTTLIDWSSGRVDGPIETMSVTKSIVSMVIGRLFREGMLGDLDMPLAETLHAWRGTPKERITLRHVMAHTSGLDSTASSEDVFASGDVVGFASQLDLVSEPGTRFAYNNGAVNLLSSVVATAVNRPLDEVAEEMLFAPLGVSSWDWQRDAAGTPLVMSGCRLHARDLALLGQVMAHEGTWGGRELLTAEWCRVSTAPAPPTSVTDLQHHLRNHGLLWWVLYPEDAPLIVDDEVIRAWHEADPPLDAAVLAQLEPLANRTYDRDGLLAAAAAALETLTAGDAPAALNTWHDSTWRRGLPDGRRLPGSEIGFYAQGAMGQHLLVVPDRRLVVVQMVGDTSTPADAGTLLQAATALLA